jgi:hypothetical protein
VQVREQPVGDLVGARRAARAAVVPARVEHEVPDDQLPAPLEQIDQARLAARSLEHVVLDDLDHRQLAPLGVQGVTRPGHRLLLCEQLDAGRAPLLSRYDVGKTHRSLLCWLSPV